MGLKAVQGTPAGAILPLIATMLEKTARWPKSDHECAEKRIPRCRVRRPWASTAFG